MGQHRFNRREFIGKSALGLVSSGLGLPFLRGKAAGQDKSLKIIKRTLGRTKFQIPLVSFGVMNSDSPELLRQAIEMGVNHLDTANVYLRGNSETFIGKTLEEDKNREKVYLGTKMRFGRDNENNVFLTQDEREPGATQPNFDKQLETSLKRLRTDHVDILYIHSCYSKDMVLFEPMMKALTKAKKEGKTRFIGMSTHRNMPECIRSAVDSGIYDVVLTSYNNMLDDKDDVKKAIAYAASKDIGVVAMKTHGGNRLNRNPKVNINHEAALKWVLQDKNVCTTIPGMTTFDQLELNFRVMNDLALTAAEQRELQLTSLAAKSFYCQNCRSCLATCPSRVEIPNLMRAHMYADGYDNLIQAEITAEVLPSAHSLHTCRDCGSCQAKCPKGIDIRGRIESLKHLV